MAKRRTKLENVSAVGRAGVRWSVMVEVRRRVVIDRPAEEVFAFLADPANDPQWRPAVKKIEIQGPLAVGTVVRQVVRGPMGDEDADYRFTAYEIGVRFAFETISGKVRPTGEFTFRPVDAGTEVSVTLSARVPLAFKPFVGIISSEMTKDADALERAKQLLEQ